MISLRIKIIIIKFSLWNFYTNYNILFSDPPEIILRPRNQQVRVGGIAAFYCTARGDPQPQIQWRKNGKRLSGKKNIRIFLLNIA